MTQLNHLSVVCCILWSLSDEHKNVHESLYTLTLTSFYNRARCGISIMKVNVVRTAPYETQTVKRSLIAHLINISGVRPCPRFVYLFSRWILGLNPQMSFVRPYWSPNCNYSFLTPNRHLCQMSKKKKKSHSIRFICVYVQPWSQLLPVSNELKYLDKELAESFPPHSAL